MRILLIEDDLLTGAIIEEALHEECYAVDWLLDGLNSEMTLQLCGYDLLLLDLGLPGQNGMDILRNTRQMRRNLPVIIISGNQLPGARIAGLDAGADDYLVKPVDVAELLARIRAVLRRGGRHHSSTIIHGAVTLNLASHEAIFGGQVVKLARREFAVLRALLDEPGTVMSKRQIEEKLYGWDAEVESNTVDVHICQLRKKLGAGFIETLRGVGYRISSCSVGRHAGEAVVEGMTGSLSQARLY